MASFHCNLVLAQYLVEDTHASVVFRLNFKSNKDRTDSFVIRVQPFPLQLVGMSALPTTVEHASFNQHSYNQFSTGPIVTQSTAGLVVFPQNSNAVPLTKAGSSASVPALCPLAYAGLTGCTTLHPDEGLYAT
mmetsp:Transcript_36468/g.81167  ORF Transcript_36468/g.81167 Transcript_36468/m.81167 type:complete len:133 (-) Transcript_36468:126-524(-)